MYPDCLAHCNCRHCQSAHTTVVSLHGYSLSVKSAVCLRVHYWYSPFQHDGCHILESPLPWEPFVSHMLSMAVLHRGKPSALRVFCVSSDHTFLPPHKTLAPTVLSHRPYRFFLFQNVCSLPPTFSVSLCFSISLSSPSPGASHMQNIHCTT